jgi:ankyrin repeat protein
MTADEISALDEQFAAALAERDFARAAQLLERGARIDLVVEREELFDRDFRMETHTYLMDAAAMGEADTVRFLLEHGADPNIASVQCGRTALLAAAMNRNAAIVDLLAARGADLYAVMRHYNYGTALEWAVGNVDPSVARSLLSAGVRPSFHRINFSIDGGANAREVVRLLVEHGGDINEIDDWGRTPLMWAAEYAELETIRAMIVLGADVSRVSEPNVNGWNRHETALGIARAKKRADVVEELRRHGAREGEWASGGVGALLTRLWLTLTNVTRT